MITWKPWTKFRKPRDEWGYHADIALEAGEEMKLVFPDGTVKKIRCVTGTHKLHIEIADEIFGESGP